MSSENKCLYFGYGSNLLCERIHMNNPSATRKGIGKLEDYRLDFGFWSKRWNGSVATVVPDRGSHVWGALWEIDKSDIPNLDRQEGVKEKIYEVIDVTVETPNSEIFICRSYQLCKLPEKIQDEKMRPDDRKPSLLYLNVIIRGAVESQLPNYYIEQLKQIQHNGWVGSTIEKVMLMNN